MSLPSSSSSSSSPAPASGGPASILLGDMAVMNPMRSFVRDQATVIAATSAAIAAVTAGYPFDLVKTRMQAFRYKHMNDCVREVYRTEGFFGFFTGVGPVVATVSVFRSITFSVYTDIKQRLGTYITSSPLTPDFLLGDRNTFRLALMSICAGTVSGSVVATLNAPVEFIKVQRQLDALIQKAALLSPSSQVSSIKSTTTSNPASVSASASSHRAHVEAAIESPPSRTLSGPAGGMGEGAAQDAGERRPTRHTTTSFTSSPASTSSTTTASTTRLANSIAFPGNATAVTPRPPMSMFQWVSHIVSLKGLPGLFSGYQWHLARDSTGTALYFCMYEVTKSILVPGSANHGVPIQFVHMFSGGFAGTASWLVLFPIDMVKSVIQREALNSSPKYQRGIDFIRHRYRKSGVMGFYRGIGPQLVRSFPVHALNFLVYEQVLSWCQNA